MRIESKLCHLSESKAVVLVHGWLDDKDIGSALGEGATVEHAEDNAITRLKKRLNLLNNNKINVETENKNQIKPHLKVELPKSERIENINNNKEPSDWSNELSSLDAEIERLNWSRDDEMKFLEKNFGYNNRNKITKYNELLSYLGLLKSIDNGISSNKYTKTIINLIEESDIILRDLSWDNNQGREYLQKEFNVSSRNELDKNQLISFIAKLKSIQNQSLSM